MIGLVLAAGGGRRMGEPKLLLPYRGRPLLAWTVELVGRLPLSARILILGAQAQAVRERMPLAGWSLVENPRWPEGMGTSLAAGVAASPQGGWLVFLGDMPHVPEEACRAVLERASTEPVAPRYGEVRGFPVFLPTHLRSELLSLKGDKGARDLLGSCITIPWDDPGVVHDVDRLEELRCDGPSA